MNVLFHTTTAIGIAVLLTDTKNISAQTSVKNKLPIALFAFGVGIVSHGALDYIPHCYPIPSKIDVLLGLSMILIGIWKSNGSYRLITAASFLGCIFPDLVDLSPALLHKYVGTPLPTIGKLFPWHWHEYSGSIYTTNCNVSTFNHLLVVLIVATVCWFRRMDLKAIFSFDTKHSSSK